ncbi:hypothetical protein JCM8097_006092 [Rhodosporidiobolus ruineniae]
MSTPIQPYDRNEVVSRYLNRMNGFRTTQDALDVQQQALYADYASLCREMHTAYAHDPTIPAQVLRGLCKPDPAAPVLAGGDTPESSSLAAVRPAQWRLTGTGTDLGFAWGSPPTGPTTILAPTLPKEADIPSLEAFSLAQPAFSNTASSTSQLEDEFSAYTAGTDYSYGPSTSSTAPTSEVSAAVGSSPKSSSAPDSSSFDRDLKYEYAVLDGMPPFGSLDILDLGQPFPMVYPDPAWTAAPTALPSPFPHSGAVRTPLFHPSMMALDGDRSFGSIELPAPAEVQSLVPPFSFPVNGIKSPKEAHKRERCRPAKGSSRKRSRSPSSDFEAGSDHDNDEDSYTPSKAVKKNSKKGAHKGKQQRKPNDGLDVALPPVDKNGESMFAVLIGKGDSSSICLIDLDASSADPSMPLSRCILNNEPYTPAMFREDCSRGHSYPFAIIGSMAFRVTFSLTGPSMMRTTDNGAEVVDDGEEYTFIHFLPGDIVVNTPWALGSSEWWRLQECKNYHASHAVANEGRWTGRTNPLKGEGSIRRNRILRHFHSDCEPAGGAASGEWSLMTLARCQRVDIGHDESAARKPKKARKGR